MTTAHIATWVATTSAGEEVKRRTSRPVPATTAATMPRASHQPPPCTSGKIVMLASMVAIQPAVASRTDADAVTIHRRWGRRPCGAGRGRRRGSDAAARAQTSGTGSAAPASATDQPPARRTSALWARCSSSSAARRSGRPADHSVVRSRIATPRAPCRPSAAQRVHLVLRRLAEDRHDHAVAAGARQRRRRRRRARGARRAARPRGRRGRRRRRPPASAVAHPAGRPSRSSRKPYRCPARCTATEAAALTAHSKLEAGPSPRWPTERLSSEHGRAHLPGLLVAAHHQLAPLARSSASAPAAGRRRSGTRGS